MGAVGTEVTLIDIFLPWGWYSYHSRWGWRRWRPAANIYVGVYTHGDIRRVRLIWWKHYNPFNERTKKETNVK